MIVAGASVVFMRYNLDSERNERVNEVLDLSKLVVTLVKASEFKIDGGHTTSMVVVLRLASKGVRRLSLAVCASLP